MSSRNPRLLASSLAIAALAGFVWYFWPAAPRSQPAPAPRPALYQPDQTPPKPTVMPSLAITPNPTITGPLTAPKKETEPAIDSILRDTSLDNIGAASALGGLVQDSSLNLEARAEALAHMLNLSVGNEASLLLPLLQSRDLPDSFASTILSDALNGPLTWQADACLAVMARTTGKELRTQAADHLNFLTKEDHGDDINAWKLAVRNTRAKWEAAGQ